MSIPKRSFSKKKLFAASLALLTIGLGSTVATGAYFTAEKTVTDNTLAAGTVAIGNFADDSNSVAALAFTNVLPIAY
ncbi:hypothetical protein [Microbacterium sp. SORGH_AS_0421]|uniref:hypothetical protein n=1 Tax=Microbacterium sp. SORGH_AS_0421 TaxID=3041768 RepID=UPI0027922658|nr:hypothetical protein [Microbacterium sp. SORGH_AS_0421]MDQ1176185.1 hypothetical protein [Microbacterium sp. SORGH_AS_0421]